MCFSPDVAAADAASIVYAESVQSMLDFCVAFVRASFRFLDSYSCLRLQQSLSTIVHVCVVSNQLVVNNEVSLKETCVGANGGDVI
jgi:hypothetical protein